MSALESLHADALSARPRHESPRLAIRALVALQNWAPLAFVPLWAWRLARRPLFTVVNGQSLAIRAAAYDRAGGFAAIRASLGEDVAFGRRRAATGHTVALVDGSEVLTCCAYESLAELWEETNRPLRLLFEIFDVDGQPFSVGTPTGDRPFQIGAELSVGRPPDVPPGTTFLTPVAVNVQPIQFRPGQQYVMRASIDGAQMDEVHFRVRQQPPQPPQRQ